jgi:hypothetical protein
LTMVFSVYIGSRAYFARTVRQNAGTAAASSVSRTGRAVSVGTN